MKSVFTMMLVLPWRVLSWLRGALANLLLLGILIAVFVGLLGDNSKPTLSDNTILYVEPGPAI
ncbi:MAG TPA: hypothetical protein PK031_10515, partial [Pseudomonadales bacterium]|nr:hypothetical protein [Pseudomonadales bacterium]